MRYMGGKGRVARQLSEVILTSTTGRDYYLEPFIGGAYMFARMAPHFRFPAGGDAMKDTALYWQAIRDGWEPPEWISREEYKALKTAEPSPLRAFAGFGCSFGGKWFGGYGAQKIDYKHPENHVSYGSMRTSIAKREALRGSLIDHIDYQRWHPGAGCVVYCDPPYSDTTAYAGMPLFDSDLFWKIADQWVNSGASVFVSEYSAPDHWNEIWSQSTPSSLKLDDNTSRVTERLFTR
jgi:DNA adenine methylase